MSSVIITLRLPQTNETRDLELPDDVMLRKLLPALVQAMGLPWINVPNTSSAYQLTLTRGSYVRTLRETDTLQLSGIVTGDILTLSSNIQHPIAQAAMQAHARLRCESGAIVALDNFGKTELSLGRYDHRTGHAPDIDLSNEPNGNTVSRYHALLRKQGTQWYLVHTAPQNFSRVGSHQIPLQQPWPLRPGDTLYLGEVKLRFEAGVTGTLPPHP